MARPIFDQTHSKTREITFSFPEFAPACKKSVHSIYSFLRQSILESHNQTHHTHFWSYPPKKILITFMQICINMQKIRMFHWFVLDIWLIKKSYKLNGWEYFGPYLRKQNFPKYEICAETPNSINFH